MLREIPESEAGHNDYARWYFEEQRRQWEAEQEAQEDKEEGLPERYL